MKRRDFLQGAGWTTIFWGLGGRDAKHQAAALSLLDRYGQAAAPTARKFALLVGLNQYAQPDIPALTGCITDLELQSQLLRHRYGFAETDLLLLSDQAATGSNLKLAMEEHLVAQVRSGDVVVCHFSGYGTQTPQGGNALVLFDRILPLDQWGTWLRSLPTPYITTILDTSFTPTPAAFPAHLKPRSLPRLAIAESQEAKTSGEPQEFLEPTADRKSQKSLALTADSEPEKSPESKEIRASPSSIASKTNNPEPKPIPLPLPGISIEAGAIGQIAIEKSWDGFSAGLFTYAFTQALWQASSSSDLGNSLEQTGINLETIALHQVPVLEGKPSISPFFLSSSLTPIASGVITAIEAEVATLWLGGLPSQVLAEYGVDSLFAAITTNPPLPPKLLQVTERSGLTAKAKILDPQTLPTVGTPIQEVVRVLPQNINLQIGLANQLTRVERVDATSAFAGIREVSLSNSSRTGEVGDYLFTQQDNRYGLSTLAGDVLPDSQGLSGEAVKAAVGRLKRQLDNLLATKLLYLTNNQGQTQQRLRITRTRTRDSYNPPPSSRQYIVENISDRTHWGYIFGTNSTQQLWLLGVSPELTAAALLPQTKLAITIPEKLTRIYGVFSSRPLGQMEQTLATLSLADNPLSSPVNTPASNPPANNPLVKPSPSVPVNPLNPPNPPTVMKLSEPLAIVKALYQDLHTADSSALPGNFSNSDRYSFDLDAWVTFWL